MDNRLHAPKHMSETSSTMLAQPRKSTKHQPASQTPSENSRCWHFTTGQSCKPPALSKGVAKEQKTCLIDVTMSYLNDHRSVDDGSNKIRGMLPEGDDTGSRVETWTGNSLAFGERREDIGRQWLGE